MQIITYKLVSSDIKLPKWNARIYKGEKLLALDFFGATEDEAKLKAKRYIGQVSSPDYLSAMAALKPASIKPEGSSNVGRGQGFVGKVWLWNEAKQERARVEPSAVDGMLSDGWIKKGPRG